MHQVKNAFKCPSNVSWRMAHGAWRMVALLELSVSLIHSPPFQHQASALSKHTSLCSQVESGTIVHSPVLTVCVCVCVRVCVCVCVLTREVRACLVHSRVF